MKPTTKGQSAPFSIKSIRKAPSPLSPSGAACGPEGDGGTDKPPC